MIDLSGLPDLNSMQAVDLALFWASRGVPVLPTNPGNKAPWVGKEWERKATTDPDQIRAWWAARPDARVGIKTGLACGCGCLDGPDVLDFDVSEGKPGIEQMQTLVNADLLDGTKALRVVTPSGGQHWWFAGSEQHNKQNDDQVWGVDLRAHHGMVLAPGNPGYVIKGVPWSDLGQSPTWLAFAACPGIRAKPGKERVAPTQPAPPRPTLLRAPSQRPWVDDAPGEESPLDWYCNHTDINDLLRQDGWTFAYEHQDRRYWTRPGKRVADGISANVMVNPDGRQTLVNYSSSVDLPTDRGLSAAQYWAHTRHGGDVRAAAAEIRRTMMPRRQQTTWQPAPGPGAPPASAGTPETAPSAELVPRADAGLPLPVQDFWQQRPELCWVWYKSKIGGVSPWAVLGHILANVAGRVGPHVALPPLGGVGAAASLNILIAISGVSGAGKGRSGQVAREFMGAPYPPQRKPGTGQGIAAMFTEQTKEGPVQSNDTVVLNVAEITNLGAHMNQQGATITSTLLEVYMGEELGEHYANKELRRPVKEGRYRLALVAGVQPDNAAILFDHAASGLPQRFLWMPAMWVDAILPEGPLKPPSPGVEIGRWRAWPDIVPGTLDETLDATGWSPSDAAGGLRAPSTNKKNAPEAVPAPLKDQILIEYSPGVARAIDTDHMRRLNAIKRRILAGEDDPGDPDSHLLLTRIKMAALLAIWLDGMTLISDEMWELAGWLVWISNDTRAKAQARIRAKAAEKNTARARAQVAQRAVIEAAKDSADEELVRKVATRIRAILEKTPGAWVPTRLISQGLAGRDKAKLKAASIDLTDVLGDMVSLGEVERQETERGGNSVTEWRK